MAFKVTAPERKLRAELTAALRERLIAVEEAISAYNAAAEEVREFAESVASRCDAEFEEKSEKWQEGARGEEVREWIDAWRDVECIDLDEVDGSGVEALEALSDDASSQ